jgi:glucosamine--fructose-6-phosphate aminotransferase (isomerizing)
MTSTREAGVSLMRREIEESGDAAARFLAANAAGLRELGIRLRKLDPPVVATIARGSSDHCALYLKYLTEVAIGVPCASIGPSIASLYRAPLKLKGALAVSISQSGRSFDIVAMQSAARGAGAFTLALVNQNDSPLAREAEVLLPLCAGPEKSVAATKSMIAGLVAAASVVAAWKDDETLLAGIARLPDILRSQEAPPPSAMVKLVAGAKSAFVLGRGATLPIAAEAALKLKETCAIHAEAFSSAEVLHGPAALVGPEFLVIAFVPQDEARDGLEETLRLLAEMGARVLRIDAGAGDSEDRLGHAAIEPPALAPIAMIHCFYRLAEAVARRLGHDPDNPRNLRKVTETR